VTLLLTGIVFIITQIALFWFSYRYRMNKNNKAYFFAHNTTLEIVWSAIPAVAMAILVVWGIKVWFEIFPKHSDLPKNRMVIEATGKQFNWIIRYPGPDGKFGKRLITKDNVCPTNELGIDFSDPASHDDFFASELHLVKGVPVEFKLGALDVLHSFYLPHMRMKMDCVPGVPTGIHFTPIKSNDDTRNELKNNPDWQKIDPETNEPRWKSFRYELACAELCGKSHYGMQMNVFVEDQAAFNKWQAAQKPIYTGVNPCTGSKEVATAKATEPAKTFEAKLGNGFELKGAVHGGIEQGLLGFIQDGTKVVDKTTWFNFDHLLFHTGKSTLEDGSKAQLTNIAEILKAHPKVKLKVGGYTDNVGDAKANMALSGDRAKEVATQLVAMGIAADRLSPEGYGDAHPVASNDTEEGRHQNRRISVRVTEK
jgi:cytochrome c oxidase subunit II